MCCFLVPMAQAVATTIYRRTIKGAGAANGSEKFSGAGTANGSGRISGAGAANGSERISGAGVFKKQIPALEKMLWGGTVMLIVDHIINGEVIFRAPFFTALEQQGGVEVMLHELLTVGLPMSAVLTAVWAIYALLSQPGEKKSNAENANA